MEVKLRYDRLLQFSLPIGNWEIKYDDHGTDFVHLICSDGNRSIELIFDTDDEQRLFVRLSKHVGFNKLAVYHQGEYQTAPHEFINVSRCIIFTQVKNEMRIYIDG